MAEDERLNADFESMQNFTGIGRPYKPPSKNDKRQTNLMSLSGAESWGHGPANFAPVKFNDNSLIPIPCLRPEDVGKTSASTVGKESKTSFWKSRRKSRNENFTMRMIPRGEYLKYYAKDDDGTYIGTEEPAPDCILRKAADLEKWRGSGLAGQAGGYKHDIVDEQPDDGSMFSGVEDDGIIR